MLFNVYCDESCHLEKDRINVMSLGAVWCPIERVTELNTRIVEIKAKHGVSQTAELKWAKVGPLKETLYTDIIDFFFDEADLHFRGLVVPDKSVLDHKKFNQTHDEWYHKMCFDLLKVIFRPKDSYNIYIDIKDTHSHERFNKLHEVASNDLYDFSSRIIKKVQPIRSHEVQIMQIVDILTGAIAYKHRKFKNGHIKSTTKLKLIDRITKRSGKNLEKNTYYQESKFNLLIWDPSRRG